MQTDNIALPYVHVREIHEFNDACEITSILGYVHGDASNITGSSIRVLDSLLGLSL
jgi:hypothetical protein